MRIPVVGRDASLTANITPHHKTLSLTWRKETRPARAITNRVLSKDGSRTGYVLFADLDGIDDSKEAVMRVYRARERLGRLGDIALIRSSRRGFHLIGLEETDALKCIVFSYLVGGGHSLDTFMRDDEMALRVSPKNGYKPEFLHVIVERTRKWMPKYSASHVHAILKEYGENLLPWCGMTEAELMDYEVKNYEFFNW